MSEAKKESMNGAMKIVEKDKKKIIENGKINNDEILWEFEEITLERGSTGLGFTVAGGTDNPHYRDDSQIYITRLIPNGPASLDGRLKLEDIITRVDETDLKNIKHSEAVAALKNSGKRVQLYIKRRKPVEKCGNITKQANFDDDTDVIDVVDVINNNNKRNSETKFQDISPRVFTSALRLQSNELPSRKDDTRDTSSISKSKAEPLTIKETKLETDVSTQSIDGSEACEDDEHNSKVHNLFGKTSSMSKSSPAIATPTLCVTKSQRKVILHRSSKGLGFNIVGDTDGGGIFISYIVPSGPAGRSNRLHCGDQIISVNGINLRSASHEQAAKTLKQAGQTVKLIVKYRPEEYMKFESRIGLLRESSMNSPGTLKTSAKISFYARALFDYDPSKDSGLPSRGLMFKFGDILHIINASDDEWWQARRVLENGQYDTVHGIIPSKKRVEKRERARQKSVKFFHRNSSESTLDRRRKRFSFTKKFPYMKSRDNMGELEDDFDLNGYESRGVLTLSSSTSVNYSDRGSSRNLEETIPSYEPVLQRDINYARPVALFGPVKEELEGLRDDLGCDERFFKMETIPPYTTRPPRQGEDDVKKYRFVTMQEMRKNISNHQFVEFGELNGHLYGTPVDSIKETAKSGKHCLLNVSLNAIKRLQDADIYPIVILIKPKSIESLLEMNKRWSHDEAVAAMDQANRLEQEYNSYLTATVQKDTFSEILREVINIVTQQSGPKIWIPTTFDAADLSS